MFYILSASCQPFFAPVSLHVLLAVVKEVKRYYAERSKYLAFRANKVKSSW